jgi:hypothetical protein
MASLYLQAMQDFILGMQSSRKDRKREWFREPTPLLSKFRWGCCVNFE